MKAKLRSIYLGLRSAQLFSLILQSIEIEVLNGSNARINPTQILLTLIQRHYKETTLPGLIQKKTTGSLHS